MAARGRASGRYPPDLPDRTSGGHRGRDAGCGMREQTANCKLQTANCKQDRSMSCVVPPSKRASIGQPNHSKRASRSESLSFAFSSLPVFTSSRLRDFEISKLHAARTVLESLERFNSPAHSPIRSHRPRCPSCAYRQALSAPGRPASAAWRRRIAQRPSGASAPKPLRRATPHARLSRARGRRRDCARPPSPDRAPDRPPRRSRRYAARTRRPDATPRRRR
ncbi:Uncharacterised protein [Burkholderia pseudomallei]|nr:Uncharacterised protein [Burkholderia pseudomallei]CAJ3319867.1 Uncharacterised protein [Burkholderia pseudomallei]VCH21284.1 Uncharacterised protein [Burkholderia pseudomallei]VCH45300.1 Uncharacterised protein [Burkholderia pseudomallei]VCH50224.1 Uncharacterised protein [Burkholderia pseudomallei]